VRQLVNKVLNNRFCVGDQNKKFVTPVFERKETKFLEITNN